MPTHDPTTPLRVGLVGAGPWASLVHAPMLAAGPETRLAGLWARRPDAAARLAARHGTTAYERIDDLYEAVDAVAFAVPPAVQATLAAAAAGAGKALLLEKPVADSLGAAEGLVAAIEAAGVPSLVALTWRYAEPVRTFLAEARTATLVAGNGVFLSNAVLDGGFRTPWRLDRGPLLDLGPHVVDLLAAALGPVVDVRCRGDRHRWVNLCLAHAGGAVSQASLSASVGVNPHRAGVEVFGETTALSVDCTTAVAADTFATLRAEFAATVGSGEPYPLDARHGLGLQQVLAAAEADLRRSG